MSLNVSVNTDSDTSPEFIDCIDSDENLETDIIKSEKLMELRHAVSKLQKEEIELVNMVYYRGASIKSYAEKKGIGYIQAIDRKNKILGKLGQNIKM